MPKPENPFNLPAAENPAADSATPQKALGDATGQNDGKTDGKTTTGMSGIAGQLERPSRLVLTPRLKGVSLLASQEERLPRLSMGRASSISALLHVVTPIVMTIAVLLFLLILSWIMHFNFWDLFRHQKPQDMTFTLVDDTHVKRPEKPMFKGNANQQAGGKQEHKQPINPGKQTTAHQPAKAENPSPPPKPQPAQPKPQAQATPPAPQPKPVVEPPKPVQKQQPEAAKVTPTVGKPAKSENEKPAQQEKPKPKAQTTPSSNPGTAPEPIQVSTATTDFGISTTPPGSAEAGNPQAGKAKDDGVDVAQDVLTGPFMADLSRRIKRNWIPPRGQESRKLVLMFYIRRDGQVVKVDVEKSSGDADADRSAIEAVQVSAPFMSLPPQIKEDILPVEFTFDYNVLNPKNSKKALKW